MESNQIEEIARDAGTAFSSLMIGLTEEIQTALKEAEAQAEEDGKSDYVVAISHSLKINPVKEKLEHSVKVSVSYKSDATTELPNPNQPQLDLG